MAAYSRRYRRIRYRYRSNSGSKNAAIGIGLAAVIIAAVSHPGTVTGAAHHAAAGLGAARLDSHISGTLDCAGLESLWEAAGGPVGAARLAAEVAMAESGGQQYARLADPDGTVDEGYWQINTSHGSLATYDALGNAKSAVTISRGGSDWTPWVTYNSGAYAGKC